ncbi:amino acid permease [Candidatus Sumerlaeota bacterium]|nr:amino acid permease [Candidatus Sumerlaeota bacterium]
MSATARTASDNQSLARALGLVSLVIFGVGDILGSGVYALTGQIASKVGEAAWMSYLLAALAAALTGLVYAEFVSRHPKAGGAAYFVATTYRSPLITFMVIFFVTLSGLFSAATAARVLADYAALLWVDAPVWFKDYLVPLLYVAAVGLVAARGIMMSSITNAICFIVEISALLFIIMIGVPFLFGGGVDFLNFAEPTEKLLIPGSLGLMMQGAAIAFFAFIGFEDIVNLSEEVRDPERNVPRAICWSIGITSLIYCLLVLVVICVLPPELRTSKTALVEAVKKAAPWFPVQLYSIIPVFAVFNTGLANILMGSRLLYGMSRGEHRQLPRILSHVHPRWQTPLVSIMVVVGITVMMICSTRDVKQLSGGTTSFLLIVFMLLHAGLIVTKRRGGDRPSFQVPTIIPICGLVVCAGLMTSRSSTDYQIAGFFILIALVIFAVNRFWLKRTVVDAID